MIYVVAKTRQQGKYYCQSVASPRLNPRARDICIISTSAPDDDTFLLGRRFEPDDLIVWYGSWWAGPYARYTEHAVRTVRATSENEPKEIHA